MSKMFDALRRAEEERRRRLSRLGGHREDRPAVEPADIPPLERTAPRPTPAVVEPIRRDGGDAPLPDDFLRELGILRNSIETLMQRKPRRTLLFTSSSHEEGTTTLATSYARLIALNSGARVLLVELNARTPSLFWRLGMKSGEGASHYLAGGRELSALVQPVEGAGFDVMHVGERDPAQIQLLLEEHFPRLIAEARQTYDTVIVDAPPIVGSPETPPMTGSVDGVVIVVQCERTKREIVQRSIDLVAQMGGRTLGVVLNRKKYYIPDFIYKRI